MHSSFGKEGDSHARKLRNWLEATSVHLPFLSCPSPPLPGQVLPEPWPLFHLLAHPAPLSLPARLLFTVHKNALVAFLPKPSDLEVRAS